MQAECADEVGGLGSGSTGGDHPKDGRNTRRRERCVPADDASFFLGQKLGFSIKRINVGFGRKGARSRYTFGMPVYNKCVWRNSYHK